MFFKKCKASVVVLFVACLVLAGCAVPEAAPAVTIEIPTEPTETTAPTATEMPAPTNTATPEPTATQLSYPDFRLLASMVYDPAADVILLLGGYLPPDKNSNEIWAYETDTNTWTQVGSISRDFFAAAYHSGAKQVVLYAGATVRGGYKYIGKTVTYDYTTNTTESVKADGTPDGYWDAQLAYDEESDVVILFGGVYRWEYKLYDDTFAYDLKTNTWTNMVPVTKPPGRAAHVMAYHPTIDRVVMFGGEMKGSEGGNETWMYDYNTNTWELIPVSNAPSSRVNSAMVYVSSLDKLILFGGASFEEGPVNDLWAFDHIENTWVELQPDNAPGARVMHAMVYDSKADKIVLFGGDSANSDPLNDTWIYDPQTNAWTEMTPSN